MQSPEQTIRVAPCLIGDNLFCFDTEAIHSITQGADCERLETPLDNGLIGETLIDGHEIPILQLQLLLGLPATTSSREHLVVLKTQRGEYGFLVDHIFRAQDIEIGEASPLPYLVRSEQHKFFHGIVRLNESPVGTENLEQTDTGITNTSKHDRAALWLSPDGLINEEPLKHYDWLTEEHTSFQHAFGDVNRRNGQLMLFDLPHASIDNQRVSFAFSVSQVLEIATSDDLLHVPGADSNVFGLIPWRDRFVPVVDLQQHLQFDQLPDSERHRIAIIRSASNELFGFFASDNIRTVRLPITAAPYQIERFQGDQAVKGCYSTDDGLIILPATESIMRNAPSTAA